MSAPALPLPPQEYSSRYFNELLRTLRLYFVGEVDVSDPLLTAITHVQTVTASTNLGVDTAGLTLVNTTGGNISIVLPAAATSLNYVFIVKRTTAGANTLVITATSGNIDGAASASIATQYDSLSFRSDGTNYWIA